MVAYNIRSLERVRGFDETSLHHKQQKQRWLHHLVHQKEAVNIIFTLWCGIALFGWYGTQTTTNQMTNWWLKSIIILMMTSITTTVLIQMAFWRGIKTIFQVDVGSSLSRYLFCNVHMCRTVYSQKNQKF